MEKNKTAYISRNYTKNDFKKIHLTMESSDEDWEKGILIFKDRMINRFFVQIDKMNLDPYENGFVTMAIVCLLIDSMVEFEPVLIESKRNNDNYKAILCQRMGDVFDYISACLFYSNIRCSILHAAETNAGSQLSCDQDEIILVKRNNISVDVVKFSNRLKVYFDDYCNRLRSKDYDTRAAFLSKMNTLCNRMQF